MIDTLLHFISFVRSHLISWFFLLIFVTFVAFIIRLNFSKEYEKFQLAQLIMRGDGTLDRKAFVSTILFFFSLYGFVEVIHRHTELIVSYFTLMATIWLGSHAIDKKLPNLGMPTTEAQK